MNRKKLPAKPAYRRQDAKTQRIFLCVMSFAADEKKKLTRAKTQRRKGLLSIPLCVMSASARKQKNRLP
jgi:hypothetical protein